jgi:cytochrome c-type biogenesis protein CcmH
MKRAFIYILLFFLATPAFALSIDAPLANAADEARAQALFHQFRCVVCQSESVADSPADVAKDVRTAIRSAIEDGKTDAEITDMLVASYGEFILMQPAFAPHNYALWLAPFVVLMLGGLWLRKLFTTRSQ